MATQQESGPTRASGAQSNRSISQWAGFLYSIGAITTFYLAYSSRFLSVLIVVYLFCLVRMARLPTARQAFYLGLATGVLTAVPQLYCFWTIFGPGAIVLWLVLGFWIGLFVALARWCRIRFAPWTPLLVPVLWTGLEYFRSELYYLRFSWLNVGYAFADNMPMPLFHILGMYGIGFVAAAIASAAADFRLVYIRPMAIALSILLGTALLLGSRQIRARTDEPVAKTVAVAGVQMEFPTENEVMLELGKVIEKTPEAQLLVLSEYTFTDPVPEKVRAWCRDHRRYLIVGGKDPTSDGNFYDTAFVVGPSGEIVFQQAKSVPIQFFKDGLPAQSQTLWDSPWGRIGLCVCYDLSYTRVTDGLVRLGAQAIIVPTMDAADWGLRQHQLHARVAPVRAAEYGIPIFRVASSGISQLVDRTGVELERAGFPGDGEILGGDLQLSQYGSRPPDRWLAPICVWATGIFCIYSLISNWLPFSRNPKSAII